MAEDGQDTSSARLTPVSKLPEEVRRFIEEENEAARLESERRKARSMRRPPDLDATLRVARETGEKFGNPKPGRALRMQPPQTS